MKSLIAILFPFVLFGQVRIHDLTDSIDSMEGGWSIGNACGVEFRLHAVYKGDLDMEGETLEILNSHFIVEGHIINQGTITYLCDDAILEIKGEVLGVEIPTKDAFKIYPNPAINEINIKGIEVNKLELFDLSGRRLKNYTTFGSLHKIMIDDLEAGVYILIINGTHTHKFIKT